MMLWICVCSCFFNIYKSVPRYIDVFDDLRALTCALCSYLERYMIFNYCYRNLIVMYNVVITVTMCCFLLLSFLLKCADESVSARRIHGP